MTDISGFMSSFISEIVKFFTKFFGILDQISFSGISLLDFTITLFVLGVAIPLVITLLPSRAVHSVREYDNRQQSEARYQRHVAEAQARHEASRNARRNRGRRGG